MKKYIAVIYDEEKGKFKNVSIKAKDDTEACAKAEELCSEKEYVEEVTRE